MHYNSVVFIGKREISLIKPTYFIADIASNHDGDLERAKKLIYLAKKSGADAVKFQHFKAEKIVSDYGFKHLGKQKSHQAKWKKSVFEIYKQYECDRDWIHELIQTARKVQIDFFTTPYDFEAVELFDLYVPAYKIGSGDITWIEIVETIAKKRKPVILSTGASNMQDVARAVNAILRYNRQIILLQCNTNYTGKKENFKFVNLKVLSTFQKKYPNMILGLSDHTPDHAAVLGAIALGARVIEKHFTDDNKRIGPDHPFSLNPKTWRDMIDKSRELELSLGDGIKKIEDNEKETVIIQRRALRLVRNLKAGSKIRAKDLVSLRPAPRGSLAPYLKQNIIGKTLKKSKIAQDVLFTTDFKD